MDSPDRYENSLFASSSPLSGQTQISDPARSVRDSYDSRYVEGRSVIDAGFEDEEAAVNSSMATKRKLEPISDVEASKKRIKLPEGIQDEREIFSTHQSRAIQAKVLLELSCLREVGGLPQPLANRLLVDDCGRLVVRETGILLSDMTSEERAGLRETIDAERSQQEPDPRPEPEEMIGCEALRTIVENWPGGNTMVHSAWKCFKASVETWLQQEEPLPLKHMLSTFVSAKMQVLNDQKTLLELVDQRKQERASVYWRPLADVVEILQGVFARVTGFSHTATGQERPWSGDNGVMTLPAQSGEVYALMHAIMTLASMGDKPSVRSTIEEHIILLLYINADKPGARRPDDWILPRQVRVRARDTSMEALQDDVNNLMDGYQERITL